MACLHGHALRDADPGYGERTRCVREVEIDGAAVGEVEGVLLSRPGRQVSLVLLAIGEQIHPRFDIPEFDLLFQQARRLDAPFGVVVEAEREWRQVRRDLYLDYRSDFARIFSETEVSLFDQCLRGVASNLGSPSKYSQMIRTTSALYRKVPDFLDLLESWKLIHKLEVRGARPEQQGFAPKRFLYDTGLANDLRLTSLPRIDILADLDAAQRTPLGGIVENMVATELVAASQTLMGWKKGINSYEVDFVYRTESGDTVPIECKASLATRPRDARGLSEYAARHGSRLGILVNLDAPGTFTTTTGLEVIHLPAYMIGTLSAIVEKHA